MSGLSIGVASLLQIHLTAPVHQYSITAILKGDLGCYINCLFSEAFLLDMISQKGKLLHQVQ